MEEKLTYTEALNMTFSELEMINLALDAQIEKTEKEMKKKSK